MSKHEHCRCDDCRNREEMATESSKAILKAITAHMENHERPRSHAELGIALAQLVELINELMIHTARIALAEKLGIFGSIGVQVVRSSEVDEPEIRAKAEVTSEDKAAVTEFLRQLGVPEAGDHAGENGENGES